MKKISIPSFCSCVLALGLSTGVQGGYRGIPYEVNLGDDETRSTVYVIPVNHNYPFSGWSHKNFFEDKLKKSPLIANEITTFEYVGIFQQMVYALGHENFSDEFYEKFRKFHFNLEYYGKDSYVRNFFKKYVAKNLNEEFFLKFGFEKDDARPLKGKEYYQDNYESFPLIAICYITYFFVKSQSIESQVMVRALPTCKKVDLDKPTSEDFLSAKKFLSNLNTLNDFMNKDKKQEILNIISKKENRFKENLFLDVLPPEIQSVLEDMSLYDAVDKTYCAAKTHWMMKREDKKKERIRQDKNFFLYNLLGFERGFLDTITSYWDVDKRNVEWISGPLLTFFQEASLNEVNILMCGSGHFERVTQLGVLQFLSSVEQNVLEGVWEEKLDIDVIKQWQKFYSTLQLKPLSQITG